MEKSMWATRCSSLSWTRSNFGRLCLLALMGCSAYRAEGPAALGPNPPRPDDSTAKAPIAVKIYLNTQGSALGAFDVMVHYVDEVGRVFDEQPPVASPQVQFLKWRRGNHRDYIRIEGFFNPSGPIEERSVHVATLTFHRHHAGSGKLSVEVVAAYDPHGKNITRQVTAHANPPLLYFR